jgi:hypothetical protein
MEAQIIDEGDEPPTPLGMMGLTKSKGESPMDEMLTIEEIEARFAPEWVLIADPVTDDGQHLLGGRVVFTSPDGDEIYRKATEPRLDRIAARFLGPLPEHVAFNL